MTRHMMRQGVFSGERGLGLLLSSRDAIVQLHTVQLPQDGSMLHFLRGTELPDEWIDFYRAQMMQPIVYHSCFISVRLVSPKHAQAWGWAGKEYSFHN
jgi:hypothetical protein